jgi:hypothetical protein
VLMRLAIPISVFVLILALACPGQVPAQVAPPEIRLPAPSEAEKQALLDRVIANQKKNEQAQLIYERVERVESRKGPPGTPPEIKITRSVPAGTGTARIPLGSEGKPADNVAYRTDLEKLEKSLLWASDSGRSQREAYDKVDKKQKERADLIDAARNAFIFTYIAREMRADRVLAKFRMEPNPAFKATSRATSIFARVRGFLWIDEAAAQLARAELEVTEDISIGGFLAKIYKGSHLMQERYEMASGVWFPSYAQYDFDGRRLFVSFGIHERTFYSQYHYVGPPKEALVTIRAELGKLRATVAEP